MPRTTQEDRQVMNFIGMIGQIMLSHENELRDFLKRSKDALNYGWLFDANLWSQGYDSLKPYVEVTEKILEVIDYLKEYLEGNVSEID